MIFTEWYDNEYHEGGYAESFTRGLKAWEAARKQTIKEYIKKISLALSKKELHQMDAYDQGFQDGLCRAIEILEG